MTSVNLQAIDRLPFIGIAEHIGIFSCVSLYCFQNAQVIVLIHPEYVEFANILWVIVVDLQPVTSPFRQHHQSSDAEWRGRQRALADAMASGVFVGEFINPVIRDRQPGNFGRTYLDSLLLITEREHRIDRLSLRIGHFHPGERLIHRHQMGNDAEDYEQDWEDPSHGLESISDRFGPADVSKCRTIESGILS